VREGEAQATHLFDRNPSGDMKRIFKYWAELQAIRTCETCFPR
jgi:hypothetical protein